MLIDHTWRLKYTSDDGDLVRLIHVPALEGAVRYDRLTGYFNANALTLAARGIEGLVLNEGRVRLVVGCTLDPPEIEAVEQGEQLRVLVEQRLKMLPLSPPDTSSADALELLAWMVARGFLDVKVAVPCDKNGKPIPADGIFHEKTGIIEDRVGNRIAWTGSLNETGAGWQYNWESISVYTSWGPETGRVNEEEANFARIWANEAHRLVVLDVPKAVRQDLMRFMPQTDLPARLERKQVFGKGRKLSAEPESRSEPASNQAFALPPESLRSRVWSFIEQAPSRQNGGALVGESTASVTPWPHQVRSLDLLYRDWPPRLLIADEVGLGKTIQAGLLMRQAWLAGRARRILILAPKAVLGQWQIELREKFNLNWPIYDGEKLTWYPSPALRGKHERKPGWKDWFREPFVITSSQLMRRADRAAALLENAEPWDLLVLDEAHHARRRGAGSQNEGGPNALLRLMQKLEERSRGLLLLTATPMQVDPVEVWDLLNLLGLPPEWTAKAFLDFFDALDQPSPSSEALDRMAALFRSVERAYGEVELVDAQRITNLSRLKTKKVLRALRDDASTPRRLLETAERRAAVKVLRANTPVRRLVSRNTRELLRQYRRAGMLPTPIAERRVEDCFLEMTADERTIYQAVEEYIAATYSRASGKERTAVGFVMTVYRRRIASSFVALRETLRKRREAIASGEEARRLSSEEDLPDDEAADEITDSEEAARLEGEALISEQNAEIDNLLAAIGRLPPDSKLGSLREVLRELRGDGFAQAMVFTQYTDTMDFLRDELLKDSGRKLICFSGRGGEVPSNDGTWQPIGRDDAKRRFHNGEADILVCTDAAAEGLNFQFCGALINYDMPWNPMRVEQRIGRIDRLGQLNDIIRVVNLHYENTVESDVYRALRNRIGLFESVVGRLQPILARLPRTISQSVLTGKSRDTRERANVVDAIDREARERQNAGFDIDAVTEADLAMPVRPPSIVSMEDLDRIITSIDLMPPGVEIRLMGTREYGLILPGMNEPLRVTTDPEYFEAHAESVELWSPGNPLFVPPEFMGAADPNTYDRTLKEILDGI